ncbi:Kinase, NEK [Giardia muris]|nr:Kinase, NEK [Giardia muris]TNJ29235.1 Kinase, NEK [Giardia muris]|eukprot:TNJ26142.1 Kinase, NEK [Giardia muris]
MARKMTLISAARSGDVEGVHQHVSCAGERDIDGMTALMHAARGGHDECVHILIPMEAGLKDVDGWTALMYSVVTGHQECVQLLASIEAAAQDKYGGTALHLAARYNKTEAIRLLLPYEERMTDLKGWSALMTAAYWGNVDCVQLLLSETCIQSTQDYIGCLKGATALMAAALRGHTAVVPILQPYESSLNDKAGHDAQWYGAHGLRSEVAQALTEDIKPPNGSSAMDMPYMAPLLKSDLSAASELSPTVSTGQTSLSIQGSSKYLLSCEDSCAGETRLLSRLLECYTIDRVISKRPFSEISIAYASDDERFAMKKVNYGFCPKSEQPRIIKAITVELSKLLDLTHPHLLGYLQALHDPEGGCVYFFTELCNRSLRDELDDRFMSGQDFTDSEIWQFLSQVSEALTYLHDRKLIHNGIKPENIFMTDGSYRVADFGLQKLFKGTAIASDREKWEYGAPELKSAKGHGTEVDVWALGVIAYQMCTGSLPFETADAIETESPIPISLRSRLLISTITQMLDKDHEKRPTMQFVMDTASAALKTAPNSTEASPKFVA